MPTVSCPIEGFEDITITYPDEWLFKHFEQYHMGASNAPINATEATKETYGTIALCDKIEGVDTSNLLELPLYMIKFFNWLKQEVYFSYMLAVSPPKKKT